jgi:hypothetical protein
MTITMVDRRLVYHARAIVESLTTAREDLMTKEWTAVVQEDATPKNTPILKADQRGPQ